MAGSKRITRRQASSAGSEIIEGLETALAYARGKTRAARVHAVHAAAPVNIRKLRQRLHMSQGQFAAQFGISMATLRNWEQGRRHPEGPARVLLNIIDREPEAVRRALR